eukprot:CCRYP_014443-RA/>CCRYP_014443-RA protein AED:0.61 eAED:0.61 QI:0/-1/0/1/-1/1/1/0/226
MSALERRLQSSNCGATRTTVATRKSASTKKSSRPDPSRSESSRPNPNEHTNPFAIVSGKPSVDPPSAAVSVCSSVEPDALVAYTHNDPPSTTAQRIQLSMCEETDYEDPHPPTAECVGELGFLNYYHSASIPVSEFEIPKLVEIQSQIEYHVNDSDRFLKYAKDAYGSYLIAYASHTFRDVYNVHDLNKNDVAAAFGLLSLPSICDGSDDEVSVGSSEARDYQAAG